MISKIQSVIAWAFLRVEAIFNAVFGDRINPFYHLGAITFFLFWVIGGSGLYLYVFFETGITDAYASVISISTTQWWLGGIMRSIHRYASDAMVLTMGLHMLRYFALNRYRGFRWFSWFTGVMLIWMVYASGINGYMLPWDQLAQFVTVATFEWLDWLPMFDGALMRNFLYTDHVGNRFFSLLSFMHVGLPLVVLLIMWVHAQNVPKARTVPPRPAIIGLLVTLLALSLIAPVHSQGGVSDLSVAVSSIELDWFYMLIFPLINKWSLGQVWALALGVSFLLVLLPWLPPKFSRGKKLPNQLTVFGTENSQAQFSVRPGETILDAGLREGLSLEYECRNGACGLCICTVERGTYNHRPYSELALTPVQKSRGMALMCCAEPKEEMVVEVAYPTGGAVITVQEYAATVKRMERLSEDVMLIDLQLAQGVTLDFKAGQYINILLENGQRRSYSFANRPQQKDVIELHVRLMPGGLFSTHVFEHMKLGDTVRFEGPLGQFILRESDLPIIFIARTTGFAPIKSIVEDAFARKVQRPMKLYWGVRKPGDFYMLELCRQWADDHPNFKIIPVISHPEPDDGWNGRTGNIHEAILADFPDLGGHEVYLCGSVRMVETAIPAMLEHGLDEELCSSDVFTIAAASGLAEPATA